MTQSLALPLLSLSVVLAACRSQHSDARWAAADAAPVATDGHAATLGPPPSAVAAVDASASGAPQVDVDLVPCPSAKVLVNGSPLKTVTTRAYGFRDVEGAYVLTLDTKDVSCQELLGEIHALKKDEILVNVGFGSVPNAQQFVNSDNDSLQTKTELATKPNAVGDAIEICVREPVRLSLSGRINALIEVNGLLRGTYCGVRK